MTAERAREIVNAFAREFARLGHPAPRIVRFMADPFYGSPHAALGVLGSSAVRRIVEDAVRASTPARGA
jgi:hypothetical protein